MKTFVLAASVAAAIAATGASFAGEPCLQRNLIYGWGARDANHVVVDDKFGKKYLLTLSGWCQDVEWGLGLSVHSFGGNELACVSRGDWVVPHGGGVTPAPGARCMISKIELYTPEMEAAYKAQKAAAKKAKEDPPPAK